MKKRLAITIIVTFLCGIFLYNKFLPTPKRIVPQTYKINLDVNPEDRWQPIIQQMNTLEILSYIKAVGKIIEAVKPKIQPFIEKLVESNLLTNEYKKELQGITQALHKKIGKLPKELQYENLVLLNIAYSLFISCTSGIIIGKEEIPYLFRNFDWPATFLRPQIINIEWYKNNSCLFKTTGWPFMIGAYTGEKNGKFAIAINARRSNDGTIANNFKNYLDNPTDVWPIGMLSRHTLQYAKDYNEAYTIFKHTKLMSPVYCVLAGTKSDEGAILVRDRHNVRIKDKLSKWKRYYPNKAVHTNPENQRSPYIIDASHATTNYIIVTNIDPDYPDFQNKDWTCKNGKCSPLLVEKKINSYGAQYRRNTALNICCTLPEDFTVETFLKNILYVKPIENFETIYSTVMCPAKNIFVSYITPSPKNKL